MGLVFAIRRLFSRPAQSDRSYASNTLERHVEQLLLEMEHHYQELGDAIGCHKVSQAGQTKGSVHSLPTLQTEDFPRIGHSFVPGPIPPN